MKKLDLTKINTESRNEASRNLDLKTTKEVLQIINQEDGKIITAVENEIPQIEKAVDLILKAVEKNGRVFYIGAGSSGRIGVLDASEMLPTYGVDDLFYGIIAGGDTALRLPIEGAEDDSELAVQDLKNVQFNANDVLFAIGASGRTPYCLGALKYAQSLKAATVALCMSENSEFAQYADVCITVLSGPEVVTGSTRMKSGTATKLVLNMISTTVMIKLGKVYDNLMIDVKATNEKLKNRSFQIVKAITEADDDTIWTVLMAAEMNVRATIVAILKNISPAEAEALIQKEPNIRNLVK